MSMRIRGLADVRCKLIIAGLATCLQRLMTVCTINPHYLMPVLLPACQLH